MLNKRKRLIQEIDALEQRLRYQQNQVATHKAEIFATFYHQYYCLLTSMLALALIVGWKIGKDIHIMNIAGYIAKNGFMTVIYPYIFSQFQI